jgi:hypothetical protein
VSVGAVADRQLSTRFAACRPGKFGKRREAPSPQAGPVAEPVAVALTPGQARRWRANDRTGPT